MAGCTSAHEVVRGSKQAHVALLHDTKLNKILTHSGGHANLTTLSLASSYSTHQVRGHLSNTRWITFRHHAPVESDSGHFPIEFQPE